MAAAQNILDKRHNPLPSHPYDDNVYTFDRIGDHNLIIAYLSFGVINIISAVNIARDIFYIFNSIRFDFIIDIGSGISNSGNNIRLNDIMISKPTKIFENVIQYNFRKTIQDKHFTRTDSLNRSPDILLEAVANLHTKHIMENYKLSEYLSAIIGKYPAI
jgi:hypothetical protein